MVGENIHTEDSFIDTDIFVVAEHSDYNDLDFVTIDHDLSDVVMIDMSQDEFLDAVTVDLGLDSDFVINAEDQIFVSDFTAEDSFIDAIDLDVSDIS